MIPVGFIGLFLFFISYKISLNYYSINIKYFYIGLFLPLTDFILKVFLSIDFSFSNTLIAHHKSIYFFHSIFTISIIILLFNIFGIFLKKKIPKSFNSSFLFGYLFYILLEILFTSNTVYVFWPIIDYELEIKSVSILAFIDTDIFDTILIFITIEIFNYFLISKFLYNIILDSNLSSKKFLTLYKWSKILKRINIILITIGFLFMIDFLINKNILLFIYILVYTLSTVRYLAIILKLNLGSLIARSR